MIRQPASKIVLRSEDLAEYERVKASWAVPAAKNETTAGDGIFMPAGDDRKQKQRERIGISSNK